MVSLNVDARSRTDSRRRPDVFPNFQEKTLMIRTLSLAGAIATLLLSSFSAEATVPRKVFGEEFGASW